MNSASDAVAAVALLALLWGRYAAPTADHPLRGVGRAAFEACWFGTGVLGALRAHRSRPRPVRPDQPAQPSMPAAEFPEHPAGRIT